MSKADEMFKKLRYEKTENNGEIRYKEENTTLGETFRFEILFVKALKVVGAKHLLNMQELQAINEKCKEMGWLDEN